MSTQKKKFQDEKAPAQRASRPKRRPAAEENIRPTSGNGGIIAAAVIAAACLIGLLCCLAFINDSQPDSYYTNAAYQPQYPPQVQYMTHPGAQGAQAYHLVAPAPGFNPTAVPVVYHNGHYYPVSGAQLPPYVPVNVPGGVPSNCPAAAAQAPVIVYLFNFDSDGVPENSTLTALANAARKNGKTVYVHAYTDEKGNAGYNQKLSERRAKAIEEYMTNHGVPQGHVVSAGHGPSHKYPSDLQNRRAEVTMN